MIKGIIFDLDGVLVFTDQYHYQAWKELADRLNIYFDEDINKRLRGVSRMESLEIILEKNHGKNYTEQEKQAFAEKKNCRYKELLQKLTPEDIAEPVRETLSELRKRGYCLAVGSSSKNAGMILERTQLREAFDAVSDGNHIKNSKPDPEVFLNAAALLQQKPEECAVVEDAYAGIRAAKAANMLAVGISDAKKCPDTDYPITQINDLLQIFK